MPTKKTGPQKGGKSAASALESSNAPSTSLGTEETINISTFQRLKMGQMFMDPMSATQAWLFWKKGGKDVNLRLLMDSNALEELRVFTADAYGKGDISKFDALDEQAQERHMLDFLCNYENLRNEAMYPEGEVSKEVLDEVVRNLCPYDPTKVRVVVALRTAKLHLIARLRDKKIFDQVDPKDVGKNTELKKVLFRKVRDELPGFVVDYYNRKSAAPVECSYSLTDSLMFLCFVCAHVIV